MRVRWCMMRMMLIVERAIKLSNISGAMIGKGEYRHFMLKEIYEQPAVIGDTLNTMVQPGTGLITLPPLPFDIAQAPRITIVACGTAYYVAVLAKYWLEQVARIPVEVDIASEFRYREAPMPKGGVALFISQSGETLDTLEALRYARRQGQHILSVINAMESTIARESDAVFYTKAGPEIAVGSTKATTTQMTVLACLALSIAKERGTLDKTRATEIAAALRAIPALAAEVLSHDDAIQTLAHDIVGANDVLFLGRGTSFAVALEGALKMKELSYIHAEAFAAGELKHGAIALVDEDVPVIALAPHDGLFEKTISNLQEAAARGGQILMISDAAGIERLGSKARWSLKMPAVDAFVAPILYVIPLQLLAYHTAVLKGTDVDMPRNLAKSVTVE